MIQAMIEMDFNYNLRRSVRPLMISFQSIHDQESLIQAYVEALCCVAGLSLQSSVAGDVARDLYPMLVKRAKQQWVLANNVLAALQLIKVPIFMFRDRKCGVGQTHFCVISG